MTTKLSPTSTFFYSDSGCFVSERGTKVFVKTRASADPARARTMLFLARREKNSLALLRGLAVPKLVNVGAHLPVRAGVRPTTTLARTFVGDGPIHSLELPPLACIGLWAFVIEQLAAFRKFGVVYTDLKCDNVVAQRQPLKAWIIDFEGASAVTRNGRFDNFGTTWGLEAPEIRRGEPPREASLVFSAALLLVELLHGADRMRRDERDAAIERATLALRSLDAVDVACLLTRAVSVDAHNRPKHYEALLAELKRTPMPPASFETWLALRRPYTKKLAELGLREPKLRL